MIEGEPKIPSGPSERIVDRWIETISVLPSKKTRLQTASLKARDMVGWLKRVHRKSLSQGGVDFLAELEEWTEDLNGLRCQIAEGDNEEREVLGSGAAIVLWETLQQGNKLRVIDNHIFVLEPK